MCLRMFVTALAIALPLASAFAKLPRLMVPVDRHVLDPERTIEDVYPGASSERMVRVATASVAIADYGLILSHFPFLMGRTQADIDRWILDSGGAYISETQAKQAIVNTPIQLTGEWRMAYRPPGYGRAVIYDVSYEGYRGLIDSNGDGAGPLHPPTHDSHGNGLGSEAEKLRDFLFENAFRASLIHANSEIGSIGSYAVIRLGFDMRYPDGNTIPAGKYMRPGHKRLLYQDHHDNIRAGWLPAEYKDDVLRHISRYGFYTGWEANIQGVRKNGRTFVFDYGHWIVWKGMVPENGIWVDPALAPNFSQWGWDEANGPRRDRDQWATSQLDRPFVWSRDVSYAGKFGRGNEDVINHYNNMVVPYLETLGVGVVPSCEALLVR